LHKILSHSRNRYQISPRWLCHKLARFIALHQIRTWIKSSRRTTKTSWLHIVTSSIHQTQYLGHRKYSKTRSRTGPNAESTPWLNLSISVLKMRISLAGPKAQVKCQVFHFFVEFFPTLFLLVFPLFFIFFCNHNQCWPSGGGGWKTCRMHDGFSKSAQCYINSTTTTADQWQQQ